MLAIVVTGFFASLIFHYEVGAVGNARYPLNNFLFRPVAQFSDFYSAFTVSQTSFAVPEGHRIVNIGWGSSVIMLYAWLLYLFFYPISLMPGMQEMRDPSFQGPFIAWCLFTAAFIVPLVYLVRRTLLRVSPDSLWAKTLILTLCSYPVLICVDRSNLENLVFVCLAGVIFLFGRKQFTWSAVLLGVIIAAKPYGVVFLVLYASDRKFKEIFISVGIAIALMGLSLLALPGSVSGNLWMLRTSMELYTNLYVLGNESMYFGSSLYNMLKVFIYWNSWILRSPMFPQFTISCVMRIYFYFAALSFLLISLLICGFRMKLWKKVALLVCCMNLLPYACGDYRLIHLFIPMLLFFRAEEAAWGDRFFSAVFALLLIPKSFYHFVFDPGMKVNAFEVADSVVVNPLLMLCLVIGICRSVFRSPELSDTGRWFLTTFASRLFPGLSPERISAR